MKAQHTKCVFGYNKNVNSNIGNSKCVLCDICNGRCKRGRSGNHANKCTNSIDTFQLENLKIE